MFKIVSAKQALFIYRQLEIVVEQYLTEKGWEKNLGGEWQKKMDIFSHPPLRMIEALTVQQSLECGR